MDVEPKDTVASNIILVADKHRAAPFRFFFARLAKPIVIVGLIIILSLNLLVVFALASVYFLILVLFAFFMGVLMVKRMRKPTEYTTEQIEKIDVDRKLLYFLRESYRDTTTYATSFSTIANLKCHSIHGGYLASMSLNGRSEDTIVVSTSRSFYVITAIIDGIETLLMQTPDRRKFNRVVEALQKAFSIDVSYEQYKLQYGRLVSQFKDNQFTFSNTRYSYKLSPGQYLFRLVSTIVALPVYTLIALNEPPISSMSWTLATIVAGLLSWFAYKDLKNWINCRKEYDALEQEYIKGLKRRTG